jgi:hypothetical protein
VDDPIVVFQMTSFDGAGDQGAAARQALAQITWARVDTVVVDSQAKEIVIGVRKGRALETAVAKSALERAGFKIGSSRYMPRGRK